MIATQASCCGNEFGKQQTQVTVECDNYEYEETLRHWNKRGYAFESVDVRRGGYRITFRLQRMLQADLL